MISVEDQWCKIYFQNVISRWSNIRHKMNFYFVEIGSANLLLLFSLYLISYFIQCVITVNRIVLFIYQLSLREQQLRNSSVRLL